MHVRITIGSVFINADGDSQNMVVTEEAEVTIAPGEEKASVDVKAACIDMSKHVPSSGVGLALSHESVRHKKEVVAVIKAANKGDHDPLARQMAIWIVRSDPADMTEMPYISGAYEISASREVQQGRIDEARTILKEAGLDPSNYRIYQ